MGAQVAVLSNPPNITSLNYKHLNSNRFYGSRFLDLSKAPKAPPALEEEGDCYWKPVDRREMENTVYTVETVLRQLKPIIEKREGNISDDREDLYSLQGTLPILFAEWKVVFPETGEFSKEAGEVQEGLRQIVQEKEAVWLTQHVIDGALWNGVALRSLMGLSELKPKDLDWPAVLRSSVRESTKEELLLYCVEHALPVASSSANPGLVQKALNEVFPDRFTVVSLPDGLYISQCRGIEPSPAPLELSDVFYGFPTKSAELKEACEKQEPLIQRSYLVIQGGQIQREHRYLGKLLDLFFPGEYHAVLVPAGIYLLPGDGEHADYLQSCQTNGVTSETMLRRLRGI